ncbi:unnamed protein product, partial [marine sediment metagenome]
NSRLSCSYFLKLLDEFPEDEQKRCMHIGLLDQNEISND